MDDVLGMGGQYMYYKYRAASKVHKVLVHGTWGVGTKRPITKCHIIILFKKIRNFSFELPVESHRSMAGQLYLCIHLQ